MASVRAVLCDSWIDLHAALSASVPQSNEPSGPLCSLNSFFFLIAARPSTVPRIRPSAAPPAAPHAYGRRLVPSLAGWPPVALVVTVVVAVVVTVAVAMGVPVDADAVCVSAGLGIVVAEGTGVTGVTGAGAATGSRTRRNDRSSRLPPVIATVSVVAT